VVKGFKWKLQMLCVQTCASRLESNHILWMRMYCISRGHADAIVVVTVGGVTFGRLTLSRKKPATSTTRPFVNYTKYTTALVIAAGEVV